MSEASGLTAKAIAERSESRRRSINMHINFLKSWYLLSFIILLFGCNSERSFDSNAWKAKGLDWQMTEVRENMIQDLINSDTLIGLNKSEIIQLLGTPDQNRDFQLGYLVREKYERDIDPVHIKYLSVNFDKTGKTINCTVHK